MFSFIDWASSMDWYCQDCYIQGACSYGSDWYYVRVGLCLIPLYVSTLVFTFCFVFISCCAYVFFPFNVDIPASMTKKIYLRHGLGVGAFRRTDGWSKRNGSRPPHFFKRSGAIDRHILQQLQKVNIIDTSTIAESMILINLNLLFFRWRKDSIQWPARSWPSCWADNFFYHVHVIFRTASYLYCVIVSYPTLLGLIIFQLGLAWFSLKLALTILNSTFLAKLP